MGYYSHLKQDHVKVTVRTANELIDGQLAKMPGGRLLDLLNTDNETFIAITDATVRNAVTGDLISEVNFLAINKQQIVFMYDEGEAPDSSDK